MQAAFERVAKGRTTVAVAHRLATIQGADIIYVLGEGKVLEKGTHVELLKKKGVYWHMVCRCDVPSDRVFSTDVCDNSATTKPSTGSRGAIRTLCYDFLYYFGLWAGEQLNHGSLAHRIHDGTVCQGFD